MWTQAKYFFPSVCQVFIPVIALVMHLELDQEFSKVWSCFWPSNRTSIGPSIQQISGPSILVTNQVFGSLFGQVFGRVLGQVLSQVFVPSESNILHISNQENKNLVKSGLVELDSNPCQQSEIKDLELSSRSKTFWDFSTFKRNRKKSL